TMQAGLLIKEVADPAQRARVEHILGASDQLTRMVTDLLDTSRIDARQLPLCAEAVDVVALSREAVERMGGDLAARVRVEARGEIPSIRADALRFEEILANLVSNAGKYSFPDTPIDVGIEARAGDV